MKRATTAVRPSLGTSPTATRVVRFEQRPRRAPEREESTPAGRVPRITRLLALAHRIDVMIRSGEIRDWAEAARLTGVTRARMTQIANLLLLAPKIQEDILNLSDVSRGEDPVTERSLREVAAQADWQSQEVPWLTPKR